MTRNPKYPLALLREHRDRTVVEATAELGAAVRQRESADAAKRRAEGERRAAEAHAVTLRAEEATRLANGELRASDLARAEGWEYAIRAQITDLVAAVSRRDGQLEVAREVEVAARATLAQKKADLDVVVKAEARRHEAALRAREAEGEDAADEMFAARWGKT